MDRVRSDIGPFAIVPLWLIESGVSDGAIRTFALMWARWADKQGECYPSHATIAAFLKVSERTVIRHLGELEEAGAVHVVRRARDNGSQTSNLYVLRASEPEWGDKGVTGGGHGCQGGDDKDVTPGVSWMSDEPYPEEPDPEEPSLSSASQPTDARSADVIMLHDSAKGERKPGVESTDQGAGLSHPSGTISSEVSQARTILIDEGYDPADVEHALTSTEGGVVVDAKWTTYRGKPYDAETLAESVRLAVAFADACDEGGNKRPNPFTHKECEPMRKLLLTDEKPSRHIRLLIRWTFDDDFWCSNVLCTRKFREKWDQLAGARRREMKKAERTQQSAPVGEDWMARTATR